MEEATPEDILAKDMQAEDRAKLRAAASAHAAFAAETALSHSAEQPSLEALEDASNVSLHDAAQAASARAVANARASRTANIAHAKKRGQGRHTKKQRSSGAHSTSTSKTHTRVLRQERSKTHQETSSKTSTKTTSKPKNTRSLIAASSTVEAVRIARSLRAQDERRMQTGQTVTSSLQSDADPTRTHHQGNLQSDANPTRTHQQNSKSKQHKQHKQDAEQKRIPQTKQATHTKAGEKTRKKRTWPAIVIRVLLALFVIISLVLICSERWLFSSWAELSIDEIMFHLRVSLAGTNTSMIFDYIRVYGVIEIIGAVVIIIALILTRKRCSTKVQRIVMALLLAIGIGNVAYTLYDANSHVNALKYMEHLTQMDAQNQTENGQQASDFVADNYVNPKTTSITFPENKRNLIYIYLESMELTFTDKQTGGTWSSNLIPELTELAREGQTFAGDDSRLNGAHSLPGTNWTMGAMFGTSSGTPLKLSVGGNMMSSEEEFFPDMKTLGDILAKEGYKQEFLLGSDAAFGGRDLFFRSHGNYDIFDYNTAKERGLIPADYYVWWGYEDQKLFQYARNELNTLAYSGQPFNFTLLTVDTHFPDGYICDLCQNEHADQYENVMSCSSRQVVEFVRWLQQQSYYQNTTVIITGDHPTMDPNFSEKIPEGYDRRTYTVILNPDPSLEMNDIEAYGQKVTQAQTQGQDQQGQGEEQAQDQQGQGQEQAQGQEQDEQAQMQTTDQHGQMQSTDQQASSELEANTTESEVSAPTEVESADEAATDAETPETELVQTAMDLSSYRQYSTMDLFPTVLATLGATIENNRLGLGVNLYAGIPTIIEQYGMETCTEELDKPSAFLDSFSHVTITEDTLRNVADEHKPRTGIDVDNTVMFMINCREINMDFVDEMKLIATDSRTGITKSFDMDLDAAENNPNLFYCTARTDYTEADLPYLSISITMSAGDIKDYEIAEANGVELRPKYHRPGADFTRRQ